MRTHKSSFLFLLVLLVALFTISTLAKKHPKPPKPVKPVVIIDSDVNTDDMMAIKYLLKYDEVQVKAITVAATGFCNVGPGINNLFGLLAFMDRNDVLVAPGEAYADIEITSGDYGFHYQKAVPLWPKGKIWADTLLGMTRHYPRLPADRYFHVGMPNYTVVIPQVINDTPAGTPIYILSTGPMTNINRLFRSQPWIKERITRIYAMGGAIYAAGNLFWPKGKVDNTYAECNMYGDPDSAKAVFASGVPITLVPLDATNYLQTTWDFINGMETDTKEAKFVHDLLFLIKNNSASTSMFSLWDPLTAGMLVDNALSVNTTTLNLDVITDWNSGELGRTVIDDVNGHPVQVVLKPDVNFYNIFTDKLNERQKKRNTK